MPHQYCTTSVVLPQEKDQKNNPKDMPETRRLRTGLSLSAEARACNSTPLQAVFALCVSGLKP
jgi:hypothetical protein